MEPLVESEIRDLEPGRRTDLAVELYVFGRNLCGGVLEPAAPVVDGRPPTWFRCAQCGKTGTLYSLCGDCPRHGDLPPPYSTEHAFAWRLMKWAGRAPERAVLFMKVLEAEVAQRTRDPIFTAENLFEVPVAQLLALAIPLDLCKAALRAALYQVGASSFP